MFFSRSSSLVFIGLAKSIWRLTDVKNQGTLSGGVDGYIGLLFYVSHSKVF